MAGVLGGLCATLLTPNIAYAGGGYADPSSFVITNSTTGDFTCSPGGFTGGLWALVPLSDYSVATSSMLSGPTWIDVSGPLFNNAGTHGDCTGGGPTPLGVPAAGVYFVVGLGTAHTFPVSYNVIWVQEVDSDGTNVYIPNPLVDTTTRIVDFTPENGTTTANPVTFSLHAYVNPDDIGTFIGVRLTLHNIDQNVLLLGAFSPSDIYLLDGFDATSSGDFYFSTTTTVGEGNYRLNAILERSYLGGWILNPFSPINQNLSHQFVVGQPTFIGNMSQNGFNELNSIFASSTATSTAANAQKCNVLNVSQFDIVGCGAFLFVPGGDYLDISVQNLKNGVLTRLPWGYFTRMAAILNASTTAPLPSFTAVIQIGPGNTNTPATTSLTFDPGDMIAGAGTLVDSIRDPINNKSVKDIFEPMVQLTVALAVLFTIVADLTGSHRHHQEQVENTNKKLS